MKDSILVKTATNLSFTGVLLEEHFLYAKQDCLVLKPSEESNIVMVIPHEEVIKIYTMEGEVRNHV